MAPAGAVTPVGTPQASGAAVASLVMGILSLFTAGLTALPAIICGHMARGKISDSNGRVGGGGLAIGGLITGYLGLVSLIAVGSFVTYTMQTKNQADETLAKQCAANGEAIARACQAYAKDHHGDFPHDLPDLIPQYLPDKSLFRTVIPVPGASQPEIGFRYFGGKSNDPPDQVLLLSLGTTTNHLKVIVFLDGTSRIVKDSELQMAQ